MLAIINAVVSWFFDFELMVIKIFIVDVILGNWEKFCIAVGEISCTNYSKYVCPIFFFICIFLKNIILLDCNKYYNNILGYIYRTSNNRIKKLIYKFEDKRKFLKILKHM